MENEIKKLENLKILTARYCNTLAPSPDNKGTYTAKINMLNYDELASTITEMLKLCIIALDYEAHKPETTKYSPINVGLILEMVLELFPTDEFELITEINEMFGGDLE